MFLLNLRLITLFNLFDAKSLAPSGILTTSSKLNAGELNGWENPFDIPYLLNCN